MLHIFIDLYVICINNDAWSTDFITFTVSELRDREMGLGAEAEAEAYM